MSAIALLTDHHHYFLYSRFVDMRKSFNGLCGIVHNELGKTVSDKDIFVFFNKRCSHVKLLLAEQDGYTLFYRRLHKGRFNVTLTDDNGPVQLNAYELQMVLSGLDWRRSKKTG